MTTSATSTPAQRKALARLERFARQREALFIAAHGPLGVVKGLEKQAAALVKVGLLAADLTLTELGQWAYETLTAPQPWSTVSPREASEMSERRRGALDFSPGYIGALSADGKTLYVTAHGSSAPVRALQAETVPAGVLVALGATSGALA